MEIYWVMFLIFAYVVVYNLVLVFITKQKHKKEKGKHEPVIECITKQIILNLKMEKEKNTKTEKVTHKVLDTRLKEGEQEKFIGSKDECKAFVSKWYDPSLHARIKIEPNAEQTNVPTVDTTTEGNGDLKTDVPAELTKVEKCAKDVLETMQTLEKQLNSLDKSEKMELFTLLQTDPIFAKAMQSFGA